MYMHTHTFIRTKLNLCDGSGSFGLLMPFPSRKDLQTTYFCSSVTKTEFEAFSLSAINFFKRSRLLQNVNMYFHDQSEQFRQPLNIDKYVQSTNYDSIMVIYNVEIPNIVVVAAIKVNYFLHIFLSIPAGDRSGGRKPVKV